MSDQKNSELRSLAAELVAAYVSNNSVSIDVLSGLINTVFDSLKSVESEPSAKVQPPGIPAVSIKKSITPDAIICLECGKKHSMIRRHLQTGHGLTPDAYRAKWELPSSYPLVAPSYAAHRSALAKKSGLGRKRNEVVATQVVVEKPKRGRKPKAS